MNTPADTSQPLSADLILDPSDNQRLANLCGPLDEHLRQVERRMGVEINNRGNTFQVIGTARSVELTERVIKDLYSTTENETLSPEKVHLFLQEASADDEEIDRDTNAITTIIFSSSKQLFLILS